MTKMRRVIVSVFVASMLLAGEAFAQCRFFCERPSLDIAHCYEFLSSRGRGSMADCEEVFTCWPTIFDPVYCEASCRGTQCYLV